MKRLLLAFGLLAACKDGGILTETGNPELDGKMQLAAHTSDADAVALGTEGSAEVVVDSATVGLERLRLFQGQGCQTPAGSNFDVSVPDTLSLVGPPDTRGFSAQEGNFCRLHIKFSVAPELDDGTLEVSGTLDDHTSFRLHSKHVQQLELRSDTAFSFSAENSSFVLGFDAARWFEGIAWDQAEITDGIVIDADNNADLLSDIEAQFDKSLDLFADTNGNGLLDEDESETVLATSDTE